MRDHHPGCWRGVLGTLGKETVQSHARLHPDPVPILASLHIRPKYSAALQTSSCLKHISPCPLPNLLWCQVSPRQGEVAMRRAGRHRGPSAGNRAQVLHRGEQPLPRAPAPFPIGKPMLKAGGCWGCGSQQHVRRALQVPCW